MVDQHLATLACMVLLPIVPAYLLFKALPSSTAAVSGALQGLKIKLTGAFAGYFAVAILIIYAHHIWAPPPAFQVWHVSGMLRDQSGRAIELIDPNNISLAPPTFSPNLGGKFKLTVITTPAQDGTPDYPVLSFHLPNFRAKSISLDPNDEDIKIKSDADKHRLNLGNIILEEVQTPAYDPRQRQAKAIPVPASQDYQ